MEAEGNELPRPGDLFADGYVIEARLGQGGMGAVFAANIDGRSVAIKVLLANRVERSSAGARVEREARAASLIDSPHVVRVERVGEVGGRPFLVMERLRGNDLAQVLRDQGPLPVARAVLDVLQALDGVAAAHARGIIHRDLKPANLFRATTEQGEIVKVLDFGISKIVDGEGQTSLTGSTATMGSPAYMSPEQVRSTKTADAKSDVWAIGMSLYELLTGVRPLEADSPGATYAAILERPIPSIRELRPDVPEGLALAVHRCLQRAPEHRFRSVAALARALAPYAGAEGAEIAARIDAQHGKETRGVTLTEGTTETPASGPRPAPRWGLGVGAALAIAGAVMIVFLARPHTSTAARAQVEIPLPSKSEATAAASLVPTPMPPAESVAHVPPPPARSTIDLDVERRVERAPIRRPPAPLPTAAELSSSAPPPSSAPSNDSVLRYRN